jgi:hypothetical protein
MGVHWIALDSGRRVFVDQLHQYRTYAGLLHGEPTIGLNDERIQKAIVRAREWIFRPVGPVLIEPERVEPTEHGPHTTEWLPRTICIAQLQDPNAPTAGSGMGFSFLSVVWFQEDFALPIGEAALEEIRRIDWDAHAEDGWE